MSERKNIDKLFQEKFKDFEMEPPEETWPELESRLKEKKDRKIIPFWWRLSGIAAALLIGFLIVNQLGLFDGKSETINGVVVKEHEKKTIKNSKDNDLNPNATDSVLVNSDQKEEILIPENNAIVTVENPGSENGNAIDNSSSEHKKTADDKIQTNKKTVNRYDKPNAEHAVANSSGGKVSKNINRSRGVIENGSGKDQQPEQTGIAENTSASKNDKQTSGIKKPNALSGSDKQNTVPGSENQSDVIAEKTTANKQQNNAAIANQNTTDVKSVEATQNNQPNQLIDGQSVANKNNTVAVAEKKSQEKKLDSAAIATVVPNALEELLKEKENKVTKEPTKLNRWQITSNVAPIYFGSTSGGSPIDSTFADNSKAYNTQLSYGIGATYAINKKFAIRTGVNRVSLSYDTNNVELFAGLDSDGLDNVDTAEENAFLNFGRERANKKSARGVAAVAENPDLVTDKFQASVNQKMGYIEVPVELSYAVIDKKFGVNVIAGVSTLFLNDNRVVVVSDGLTTNLGEANNLNKTHFSTNVGLGLKYAFTKSLQANFEPIFKYQLNTFSKNSGDFKPYFFGLYTGLSFRF